MGLFRRAQRQLVALQRVFLGFDTNSTIASKTCSPFVVAVHTVERYKLNSFLSCGDGLYARCVYESTDLRGACGEKTRGGRLFFVVPEAE